MAAIIDFCTKWKIREFALFGSALSDRFEPDSDLDVLVTFEPDHGWSLFDHMTMEEELASVVGRPVDVVSKAAILSADNPVRRQLILGSARTVYAAA
jgi:predicted nucleotidyltransferase